MIQKAIGSDPLPVEDLEGAVIRTNSRSTKYQSDLRGLSKALELYETREFDSKLEDDIGSLSEGMGTNEKSKEEEKKEDTTSIEDTNDQGDIIVYENKSDDDSDFGGDDDVELTALRKKHDAPPDDRQSNERDRNLKSIVQ